MLSNRQPAYPRLWVGVLYQYGKKRQMVFNYLTANDWLSLGGMWRCFHKDFGRVPDKYTTINIWE
jgi:hypothetical protein